MYFVISLKILTIIIIVITITQFPQYNCEISNLLPPVTRISKQSEKVLTDIISTTITSKDKVLYASTNQDLNVVNLIRKYSKIIFDSTQNIGYYNFPKPFVHFRLIDTYILAINSTLSINSLRSLLEWNSRAKFVIYYVYDYSITGTDCELMHLQEFFEYLGKYFIYNVIIVVPSGLVYTYFPYKYENVHEPSSEPVLIDSESVYFPEKLPKLWRNSTIIILATTLSPFVVDYNQEVITGGIEYRLVEEIIRKQFQFHAVEYRIEISGIGWRLLNGTYLFLLSRLKDREGDFCIGGAQLINPYHMIDFDAPLPYSDDDTIWIVPTPRILSHTMNLTRIFTPEMWIALGSTMILGSAFWIFFGTFAPWEVSYFKNKYNAATMPWKFLFNELSDHVPSSPQLKLLFCCTWLFVFTVNAAWEAHLVFTLSFDRRDQSIETIQDILDMNMKINIPSSQANLYKEIGTTTTGVTIFERNVPTDKFNDLHVAVNRVSEKKDTVTVATRQVMRVVLEMGFFDDHGIPGLRTIEEKFWHTSVVEYFARGHPVFPRYNKIMNWIRASGVSDIYLQQLYHSYRVTFSRHEDVVNKMLRVSQLSSAFYILICGHVLASVVFLTEFCVETRIPKAFYTRSYLTQVTTERIP